MANHFASALTEKLNWDVKQMAVYANNKQIPAYKAILRSDNDYCLDIVKPTYMPTTNARLMGIADRLVNITGFQLEGFTEFKGGKFVLGYLRANNSTDFMGYEHENYIVIGNSHDRSTSFFVATSDIMLRCMNQFSHINQKLRVRHSKHQDIKTEEILAFFQAYKEEQERVKLTLERMYKVKIDSSIIDALTEKLFKIDTGVEESLNTRKQNILSSFKESVAIETAELGDNMFGLFNAVTHYTTHTQKTQGDKLPGNVLGLGADLNNKAYNFALEAIKLYN